MEAKMGTYKQFLKSKTTVIQKLTQNIQPKRYFVLRQIKPFRSFLPPFMSSQLKTLTLTGESIGAWFIIKKIKPLNKDSFIICTIICIQVKISVSV